MLNITGLNQYYGGSHILRNVALDVPKGSLTVLLGRNGVARSRFKLRGLFGLLRVTVVCVGRHVVSPLSTLVRRRCMLRCGASFAVSVSIRRATFKERALLRITSISNEQRSRRWAI